MKLSSDATMFVGRLRSSVQQALKWSTLEEILEKAEMDRTTYDAIASGETIPPGDEVLRPLFKALLWHAHEVESLLQDARSARTQYSEFWLTDEGFECADRHLVSRLKYDYMAATLDYAAKAYKDEVLRLQAILDDNDRA